MFSVFFFVFPDFHVLFSMLSTEEQLIRFRVTSVHFPEAPRKTQLPGVTKGCFLEVFKYSKASKKHSFVTPGIFDIVFLGV